MMYQSNRFIKFCSIKTSHEALFNVKTLVYATGPANLENFGNCKKTEKLRYIISRHIFTSIPFTILNLIRMNRTLGGILYLEAQSSVFPAYITHLSLYVDLWIISFMINFKNLLLKHLLNLNPMTKNGFNIS